MQPAAANSLDLALALHTDKSTPAARATLLGLWQWVYWTTFVLSWVVTPVLMDFKMAGEFTRWGRLRYAVRAQLRFYGWLAAAIVVVAFVLVFTQGFKASFVQDALVAAANIYCALLIVLMLGFGLVNVPRKLWRASSPRAALLRLEFAAALLDTDVFDARRARRTSSSASSTAAPLT